MDRKQYIETLAKYLERGYTLIWYPHNGYWVAHHPREQLHLIQPSIIHVPGEKMVLYIPREKQEK